MRRPLLFSPPLPGGWATVAVFLLALVFGGNTRGAAAAPYEIGRPPVRNFSPAEYEGHPKNRGVALDADGLLYVGNEGAVLQYDGAGWQRLLLPVAAGFVWSLAADADGRRIWVGATNEFGYLEPGSKDGSARYVSLRDLAPAGEVSCGDVAGVCVTPAGVFFAGENRLFRWDGRALRSWTLDRPGPAACFWVNGRLLVVKPQGPLRALGADGELVEVSADRRFLSDRVHSLLAWEPDGTVLVGFREGGFARLCPDGRLDPFPTEADDFLRANLATRAMTVRGGETLAVATLKGGLVTLDRAGRFGRLVDETSGGLGSQSVFDVLGDRGGKNLWLCTDHGLSLVELPSAVSLFDTARGFAGRAAIVSLERHGGVLFAATRYGLHRLTPPVRLPEVARLEPVPGAEGIDQALASHAAGLLGAGEKGVYLYDGRACRLIASTPEPAQALARSRADPDLIHVGLRRGLTRLRHRDGAWREEPPTLSEPLTADVCSLAETADGALWLGTAAEGVFRLKPRAGGVGYDLRRFGPGEGLPAGHGAARVHVSGDRLLFDTEKGLYRLDAAGDRCVPETGYGRELADGSRAVRLYARGADGRAWLVQGENDAIGRASYRVRVGAAAPVPPGEAARFEALPELFGERSVEMSAGFVDEDSGVVWLGVGTGLARLETSAAADAAAVPRPPVTLIRAVADPAGHPLPAAAGPWPYRDNSPRFRFATPDFAVGRAPVYQTWLEGAENGWSAPSAATGRQFTNLPEGPYVFRVRAGNRLGQPLGAEARYPFRIAPPWSRAPWAYALYALGGVMLVVGSAQWRSVRLRADKRRLEGEVRERTAELAMSEAKFRSIFEEAAEGIYQSSPEGRSLDVNPAMTRLCGYEIPSEMTAALTDLATQFYVQPGRRAEVNAELERRGTLVGVESEIRRRDGTTFWGSENVRLLRDGRTGETLYLGSLVDVTERRRSREEFRRAKEAADAASEAKGAFLANMSHELRTPLNAILGHAQILQGDPALGERPRTRAGVIIQSGEHLLTLINEVLDLARIEAGKLELQGEPFSPRSLARDVTAAVAPRAVEKRLRLEVSVEPAVAPRVLGDAGKLRQVLLNLLGNAVKFTPACGGVRLELTKTGLDEGVRFLVADTGPGIPADQLETIFTAFHQVATPGRLPAGTGLGLSISRRLVALLGGELRVESTPGQGAAFSFVVPLPAVPGGEEEVVNPAAGDLLGVEWTGGGMSTSGAPAAIAPPPAAVVDELSLLCSQGDVQALRRRLRELGRDPGLAALLGEISPLVESFRLDEARLVLLRATGNAGEEGDAP